MVFKKILNDFIGSLTPIEEGTITFLSYTPYSGCNVQALYNYIVNSIKYNHKLNIIYVTDKLTLKEKVKMKIQLAKSEIIISSHGIKRMKKKQRLIQIWHGVPLKAMGLMDKGNYSNWIRNDKKTFDEVDFYSSLGTLYTTILNSTIGQPINKYIVCGYPRNDLLFDKKAIDYSRIFNNYKSDNKTIFFIPTYKKGYVDRCEGNNRESNFFGFENLDYNLLSSFLKESNLNLIIKLHPLEEKFYLNEMENMNYENIFILKSEILSENRLDIYDFLSNSDLLITDYSSIYFDYLLTNNPIIFINNDEKTYKSSRGLLLEPYNFWTPGPKVDNFDKLKLEISKSLNNKLYYEEERTTICNLLHEHKDGKSSERTWNFINNILKVR